MEDSGGRQGKPKPYTSTTPARQRKTDTSAPSSIRTVPIAGILVAALSNFARLGPAYDTARTSMIFCLKPARVRCLELPLSRTKRAQLSSNGDWIGLIQPTDGGSARRGYEHS